jgi:hypothetical protein
VRLGGAGKPVRLSIVGLQSRGYSVVQVGEVSISAGFQCTTGVKEMKVPQYSKSVSIVQ